jgi:hypothetical protein
MTIKTKKEIRGAHEHLDVFVGPDKDHLALSGHLVLREKEAREVEYALNAPHKACSCGKVYSEVSWSELKFVGFQPTEDDDGKPYNLELKNCRVCGSTLACAEKT